MSTAATVAVTARPSAELSVPGLGINLGDAWLNSVAPSSRRIYRSAVAAFGTWLAERGVPMSEVRRPHVDTYRDHLAGQCDYKPATVARHLSILSSLYEYLAGEGITADNPVKRATRPKVDPDHSDTQGLSPEEVRRVIAAGAADGPRSAVIVAALAVLGLRCAELAAANVADLGHERDHDTLTVTRKGGKRQAIPVPPVVWQAVMRYLAGRTTGPLLATSTGRHMATSEVSRTVTRIARAAGIARHVHPHMLRHTVATTALDAGASLRDVQDLLGHADPRTTRRYDRARGKLDNSPVYGVADALAGPLTAAHPTRATHRHGAGARTGRRYYDARRAR